MGYELWVGMLKCRRAGLELGPLTRRGGSSDTKLPVNNTFSN